MVKHDFSLAAWVRPYGNQPASIFYLCETMLMPGWLRLLYRRGTRLREMAAGGCEGYGKGMQKLRRDETVPVQTVESLTVTVRNRCISRPRACRNHRQHLPHLTHHLCHVRFFLTFFFFRSCSFSRGVLFATLPYKHTLWVQRETWISAIRTAAHAQPVIMLLALRVTFPSFALNVIHTSQAHIFHLYSSRFLHIPVIALLIYSYTRIYSSYFHCIYCSYARMYSL